MSVLLLSGGLDSAVCLALERPDAALFVDYGQPQQLQERRAAHQLALDHAVPFHVGVIDLPAWRANPADKTMLVPGRNRLLIARRRMDEAMNAVCDGTPETWLHMLRGLSLAGSEYPFASADSTLIAQNHAGNNTRATPPKDARAMADRIDGLQCPARWTMRNATISMEVTHDTE